jgi:predicted lipoprotein with Yx(FWY)xxD motif
VLYTFTKGVDCTGACAKAWPPLLAPADAKASGKFSIVTRPDGTKQWAYDGKPLYLFVKDKKPGQETGNGITHFGGTWSVAKANE